MHLVKWEVKSETNIECSRAIKRVEHYIVRSKDRRNFADWLLIYI